MKTNHLSIILGALLLAPGLTARSTNTSAQPIENTTATQSPEQKSMTPEEEQMIETIKDIFRAMAEPGITPKALASRFGKLDPKENGVALPFNESFTELQVIASNEDSNVVEFFDLDLAPSTLVSIDSLKKIFGNYAEPPREHWNSSRDIMFKSKLPEIQGYTCRFIVKYEFRPQGDKSPPGISFSFYMYPDK